MITDGSNELRTNCLNVITAKQQAQQLSSTKLGTDKNKITLGGYATFNINKAFKPALLEISFIPMNHCATSGY
jgi:hypothetical protein